MWQDKIHLSIVDGCVSGYWLSVGVCWQNLLKYEMGLSLDSECKQLCMKTLAEMVIATAKKQRQNRHLEFIRGSARVRNIL